MLGFTEILWLATGAHDGKFCSRQTVRLNVMHAVAKWGVKLGQKDMSPFGGGGGAHFKVRGNKRPEMLNESNMDRLIGAVRGEGLKNTQQQDGCCGVEAETSKTTKTETNLLLSALARIAGLGSALPFVVRHSWSRHFERRTEGVARVRPAIG